MSKSNKAVILLSGGLDSTTVFAIAKSQGYLPYALSFEYGQKNSTEVKSAIKVAKLMGAIDHKIANIDLGVFGGSALTDDIEVPKDTDISSDHIPVTYVPARNTIFLSFALAYAETIGSFNIFIGANAVDYSGYPDCRPEYLRAYENMANLATAASTQSQEKYKIHSPLLQMSKAQIIKTGIDLGVDYSYTSSCYDPLPSGEKCNKCESCQIRAKGFADNNLQDNSL